MQRTDRDHHDASLPARQMQELAGLWTRAQPAVAAFVQTVVRDFHEAEDLVQKVAEAAVIKFHEYDRSRSFTGWAIGIARYEVLRRRRDHATDRHCFDSEAMEQIAAAFDRLEGQLDPMRQALRDCVALLTGRNRTVIEMRYGEASDIDDIARRMRMKPNAVYVLLHRVRGMVRRCVEQRLPGGGA